MRLRKYCLRSAAHVRPHYRRQSTRPPSRNHSSRNHQRIMTSQQTPDYRNYTHADLLKRVTDLEAQLSALNTTHGRPPSSASSSVAPPKKKPRKEPKPFDPSRYSTRHIALKFAYLGGNYNGFEHHSNNKTPLPTIEEELWKALRKVKLIFPDFKGRSEEEVCWAVSYTHLTLPTKRIV